MAKDKKQPVEGEPHKKYRLATDSDVLESYATAKEAMQNCAKLREVVLMSNPKGRLIIRDGSTEINFHQLKRLAAEEE